MRRMRKGRGQTEQARACGAHEVRKSKPLKNKKRRDEKRRNSSYCMSQKIKDAIDVRQDMTKKETPSKC
jgi:hypothetical protein